VHTRAEHDDRSDARRFSPATAVCNICFSPDAIPLCRMRKAQRKLLCASAVLLLPLLHSRPTSTSLCVCETLRDIAARSRLKARQAARSTQGAMAAHPPENGERIMVFKVGK
jgi:hypothetical protein